MSKLCAFCDLPRRLTREHIWPNGFLKRNSYGLRYSSRAGRAHGGDLIVRDVCEVCNNGPLSNLDAYACKLHDTNFGAFPEHGEAVQFQFEYSKLMRWLIKVAFNSARAQGHQDAELLRRYRAAILAEGDNCPIYVNAFLAIVGPGKLDFPGGRSSEKIYPKAARSGPVIVPTVNGYQHVSSRMVMINAYFFTLIISRTPQMPADEVGDLIRGIPGRPLAYDGAMILKPIMTANQALEGIQYWPRQARKR